MIALKVHYISFDFFFFQIIGGPLSKGGIVVGIMMWNIACGFTSEPDVYARISFFRDWIRDISGV